MGNKEIWTEIAEVFYTKPIIRRDKYGVLGSLGICEAYSMRANERSVSSIFEESELRGDGFILPTYLDIEEWEQEHDNIRGDFATLMSCLTDEEFEELCNGE